MEERKIVTEIRKLWETGNLIEIVRSLSKEHGMEGTTMEVQGSNEEYSVGAWTAIKLVALGYYSRMFSIAGKSKKRIYIDMFAGNGLTKIRETGDVLPGSPVVALQAAKNEFDTVYLSDSDQRNINDLNTTIEILKEEFGLNTENVHIDCMDCGEAISGITKDLGRRYEAVLSDEDPPFIFLSFIDPYGFDPTWGSMKELLSYQGDVIMNFQTHQIPRNLLEDGPARSLEAFLGEVPCNRIRDDRFPGCRTKLERAERLRDDYINQLSRTPVENPRINRKKHDYLRIGKGRGLGGGYFYDLIFAARETGGGSEWFDNTIPSMKELLQDESGDSVRKILNVVSGPDTSLFEYGD